MVAARSCRECGATWPTTAPSRFCGRCGARLDDVVAVDHAGSALPIRLLALVGLVLVTATLIAAGWRSLARPADVRGNDVDVPGDGNLRTPAAVDELPRCQVYEREGPCVTWRVVENLRDAEHVGDRVVVLNTNGTVAGVDPSSGAITWATRTGLLDAFLITGEATDRAIVRRDDTILLFDTEVGEQLGRMRGDFEAIDADHLVLSTDDRIVVADVRTGRELGSWNLPTPGSLLHGLGRHHLIVEDADRVLALDLVSGEAAWERSLAPRERIRTAGGGTILLQTGTELTALDELTGEMRWTVPFDGVLSVRHIPGADSLTAATSRDGATFELVHFDAATGREVWRTMITDPERPNDTRVIPGAVALRWHDEWRLVDRLEYAPIPGEGYLDTRSFTFPADGPRNARIVRIDPLVVATDDGLYGLDPSALEH